MNGLVVIIGWLALMGRYPMVVTYDEFGKKKTFTELVHEKFKIGKKV